MQWFTLTWLWYPDANRDFWFFSQFRRMFTAPIIHPQFIPTLSGKTLLPLSAPCVIFVLIQPTCGRGEYFTESMSCFTDVGRDPWLRIRSYPRNWYSSSNKLCRSVFKIICLLFGSSGNPGVPLHELASNVWLTQADLAAAARKDS